MTALTFAPNGVQKSSLSNIIEEWFSNDSIRRGNFNNPSTNILEYNDKYIIELSVPGCTKESFNINVDNEKLSISSTQKTEQSEEKDMYKMKEFSMSSFTKSFHLSDDIMKEKISASCNNGILEITLPKKEEAKRLPPRTINID